MRPHSRYILNLHINAVTWKVFLQTVCTQYKNVSTSGLSKAHILVIKRKWNNWSKHLRSFFMSLFLLCQEYNATNTD